MKTIEQIKEDAMIANARNYEIAKREILDSITNKIERTLRANLMARLCYFKNSNDYYDYNDCEVEELFTDPVIFKIVQDELAKSGYKMEKVTFKRRKFFIFPTSQEAIVVTWQ